MPAFDSGSGGQRGKEGAYTAIQRRHLARTLSQRRAWIRQLCLESQAIRLPACHKRGPTHSGRGGVGGFTRAGGLFCGRNLTTFIVEARSLLQLLPYAACPFPSIQTLYYHDNPKEDVNFPAALVADSETRKLCMRFSDWPLASSGNSLRVNLWQLQQCRSRNCVSARVPG